MLSIVVVILAIAVGGGIFALTLANKFDAYEKIDDPFPDEAGRPAKSDTGSQNILLLGSDTRGEIGDKELDNIKGDRSDSMMIVHIPGNREGIFVTSIMRDSWVPIPGRGSAKINAAMAYGGPKLAVQTVETLINARIDHVAVIDFDGFEGLTDALGGVTINNPIAFTATHGKQHFKQGEITLSGKDALSFVRERYSFKDGDYQRARNQQLYMKGVMNKLLSKDTLTNPGRVIESIDAISPFLKADSGMNAAYVAGLAPSLAGVRGEDVQFITAPTSGTGTSPDGQSIVRLDEVKMGQLATAFQTDKLADFFAANKK
ncbi:LCP family protein [Mycetocola tolaasinivorans]|uniref:LCP family protein n=1 Tax=Mycetocola tolaasinivorans TaxID=76635 RepID=UPI001FE7029F|nr:LCP family protein [Mycetocola tolaasinivorans]